MEMQALTKLLHEKNCSCVISNRETRIFSRSGVIDIYDLLYSDWFFLSGATIAYRVAGKAAAALMVLGGVKEVHADVISRQAYNLLKGYNIEVEYDEMAGFIRNRDHSGSCPLEKLCSGENDLMNILGIIDRFMSRKAS